MDPQPNDIKQQSKIYDINNDSSQSSEDQKNYHSLNRYNNELNIDQSQNIFSYYSNTKYKQSSDQQSMSDVQPNYDNTSHQQSDQKCRQSQNRQKLVNETQNSTYNKNQNKIDIPEDQPNSKFIKGKSYTQKQQDQKQSRVTHTNQTQQQNIKQQQKQQPPLKKKKRKKHKNIFSGKYILKQKKLPDLKLQQQLSVQQQNAMNIVYFQKKRQNHKQLKLWNYKRINALQIHRKVMDNISQNIDDKMSSSLKHLELYYQFYKQRINQQQKYIKHIQFNIGSQLQQQQISNRIYIAPSTLLLSISQKLNQSKTAQIAQFIKCIRQKIVKNLFQEYFLTQNKKKLIVIRQQISTMKQKLNNINNQVSNKLIKLQNKFAEASDNIIQNKSDFTHDFYRTQISFLRKCCLQMESQVMLAKKIIQYSEIAKQQEKHRAAIIKQSLIIYYNAIGQKQRSQKQFSPQIPEQQKELKYRLEQMQKNQQQKLINQFYSFEDVICEQMIGQIKQHLTEWKLRQLSPLLRNKKNQQQNQEQQNSSDKFFQFLRIYPLQFQDLFNCRHLILKQFKIQMQLLGLQKSIQIEKQQWEKCKIIITIDKYVHIVPTYSQQQAIIKAYHKPYYTMRANFIEIQYEGSISNNKQKSSSPITPKQQTYNGQSGGQSCSQNQSQSTLNCFIIKLYPKKNWKNFLFEGNRQFKKIKFYLDQDLSEFEDYLAEFSA